MGFSHVRFIQFRNLEDKEISLGNAREIFLVGENGQGKTNFLEGIYLLCYGSSFRTKTEKRLFRHGFQELSLFGDFERNSELHTVSLKITKESKRIEWDNHLIADRKEMVQTLPCIAFTHEDYLFVQGGPENQRFFFDQTLSLYDVLYIDSLRQYKRLLRTRNFLLLSREDSLGLDVWEEKLVQAGWELMNAREKLVREFNSLFPELFRKVSGMEGSSEIRYLPSWKGSDPQAVLKSLTESRSQERDLGFTSSGPHRDRFVFSFRGRNFAESASTGQIRLLSLLLRTAQARFSEGKTGKKPILLLDDVLLELDGEKRIRFLEELPEPEQVIFTFLPEENIGAYKTTSPLILKVQGGSFEKHGRGS